MRSMRHSFRPGNGAVSAHIPNYIIDWIPALVVGILHHTLSLKIMIVLCAAQVPVHRSAFRAVRKPKRG